jgi:hypothetical protein
MYTYQYSESKGVSLMWFKAEGKSLFEVATLFQNKLLNIKYIREAIYSPDVSVLVAFTNHHEYVIERDVDYNLYLVPAENVNDCFNIELTFDDSGYVSKKYRMPVDSISNDTWSTIVPNNWHRCDGVEYHIEPDFDDFDCDDNGFDDFDDHAFDYNDFDDHYYNDFDDDIEYPADKAATDEPGVSVDDTDELVLIY